MKAISSFVLCCLLIVGRLQAQEVFLGKTLDQWSQELTTWEGQKRVHAAWAIAQLVGRSSGGPADEEGFAELIKLVNDSDPAVRHWGASGLAAFARRLDKRDGGRQAAINALEPLLVDKAAAPRIAAAQALGELGQAARVLSVIASAMRDPEEAVRVQAVQALEKLGPAALPAEATLRTAAHDPSDRVRQTAARALAALAPDKNSPTQESAKR